MVTLVLGTAMVLMRPVASNAYVYDPPWADAMYAHYPGSGGLDTTGTMSFVKNQFEVSAYHAFSSNPSSAKATLGTSFAQSDAIWWIAGHAKAGAISTYNTTTGTSNVFVTSSAGPCTTPNACLSGYTSTLMHRINLMVFMGCDSADPVGTDTLPKYAYQNLGVDSTIGFTAIILFSYNTSDTWANKMAQYTRTWSVSTAAWNATQLIHDTTGSYAGYDSLSIYGGTNLVYPAEYGT